MEIGGRLWKVFAEDTFDFLGHLDTIYSGYGDILTTEEERMNLLRSGKVVAVHQIKSDIDL
jgi:hypothetical protein